MSATNTQNTLSSEAEAYIAQMKEAFAKSPDGYELPAGSSVEDINMYYQQVAEYAMTQAEDACKKNGYVDTRTGAYADLDSANKDREAFDNRNKKFQFGNQYKDLGDRDKLQSDYNKAVANGQTEMAEALSSSLEAIDNADKSISDRKAAAQIKYDNAGYGIDARDTEIAFWNEWLKGDTEAINNAFSAYKDADNKNFEVNVMPEMASGIQSQADAEAYNKACEAHGIKGFDPANGNTISPEAKKIIEEAKNKDVELSSEATEKLEAYAKESAAAAAPEAETVSQASKTDPYAGFEKPACPSGMPSSAYEQMCAMQERQYRQSINEARAAEIMAAGDYKNNNDYLNQLVEDGYDVAAVQSIMDEKSKAAERTAEVAESDAKSSEKPNPYAFEKPERPENMSDKDYDDMCKLAEAEHIDKVNHDFAAEINAGKYGNGHEARRAAIEAQGGDYEAVRAVINNEYVPLYEAEQKKQAEAKAAEQSTVSAEDKAAAVTKISLDGIPVPEGANIGEQQLSDSVGVTGRNLAEKGLSEPEGASIGEEQHDMSGAEGMSAHNLTKEAEPVGSKLGEEQHDISEAEGVTGHNLAKVSVSESKKDNRRTLGTPAVTTETMTRTVSTTKPAETKPAETSQPTASSSISTGTYVGDVHLTHGPSNSGYLDPDKVVNGKDVAYFKDQPATNMTVDIPQNSGTVDIPQNSGTVDTNKVLSGKSAVYRNPNRFNSGTHVADNIKQKDDNEIAYDSN